MINFFQVSPQNEEDITTEADIICFLKNVFNETENIHDPCDTQEYILSAKEKQESYKELLERINKNWDAWQAKNGSTPSGQTEKLHDIVLSNFYLRRGHCEKELSQNSSESYKQALELLRKHKVPHENSIKSTNNDDALLELLICLNLGKYLRNMSYFENRSQFSLARHEFEKIKHSLEEENKFLDQSRIQIWLEAKTNIVKCQKNLYELKEAEDTFREIISGLLPWVSSDQKNIFEKTQFNLNLPELSENEKKIYEHLNGNEQMADLFFIRTLVQLAIIYRKQRYYEKAKTVCEAVLSVEPNNKDAKNNLGVCYRKNGEFTEAIKQFELLMQKGNRFAKINYWKCILRQKELPKRFTSASDEEIKKFLGNKTVTINV